MAPAYASLFMGKLEMDFLNSREIKPSMWFRFLDDIFLIWDGKLEDLHTFLDDLNKYHPNIKFTNTISQDSVEFLDVLISKSESLCIETDIFVKRTNNHQYLHYTSCHPKTCKDGIPFSQAKRYRRIISRDNTFENSLMDLRNYFMDRDYPPSVLNSAFQLASSLSQNDALIPSSSEKNSDVIPFVVTYNPSLPNIGHVINKYWDLLKLSKSENVQCVYKQFKPIIAYKRPYNLRNHLVRSDFSSQNISFVSSACNRSRCSHCKNIKVDSSFTSNVTGDSYCLRHNTNCRTNDVIYAISCKKCNIQYIGQAMQPVSKRMNNHRFDINGYIDPAFSTNVAIHFNSSNHSINDFAFMPIDIVHNNFDRLCKETYWIHKLDTLSPNGLNAKVIYNI